MEFKNVVFNAARDGKLRRLKVKATLLRVFSKESLEDRVSRKLSECEVDRQLRPSDAAAVSYPESVSTRTGHLSQGQNTKNVKAERC